MEDKKYRFGRIRWWQWLFLFIAVPIVMWVLMLIPTIPIDNLINETHWLSFFGGYIGACITGLITLYVLRLTSLYNTKNLKLTLKQNQANHKELVELQNTTNDKNEALNRQNREQSEKQNQENRQQNETLNRENREQNEILNRRQQQLHINTTLYVQEQAYIEKLRLLFDEIYKTFDYQRFAIAINYLFSGNVDYANQLLLSLNRDIEMCGAKTDLYFPKFEEGEEEIVTQCRNILRDSTISYGAMVNEFIFVISLLNNFKNKPLLVTDIVDFVRRSYEAYKKHIKLAPELYEAYNNENIYEDLLKLQHRAAYQDTIDDINNIVIGRLEKVITAHISKGELLRTTRIFIEYKNSEAKKILTEKLED